jgi:F-type H+-transporting ATPase subunit epsilon
MRVRIISPDRVLYDDEATALIAPAFDGEVGILPRHAPFMTLLGEGRVVVRQGAASHRFQVRGGFLQVRHDLVRIVTEHAKGDRDAA